MGFELTADDLPALVVLVTALAMVAQHFVRQGLRPGVERSAGEHWWRRAAAGVVMTALGLAAAVGVGVDTLRLLVPGYASISVLPWMALAMAVMVAGSYVASRKPDFRDHYPEAPVARWTRASWTSNAGAWALYLFGYELVFRGLCLHALCAAWGTLSGIAVTTALYAVAHLPKNLSESLGSFPMGVVFAALTLASGSLWPAFALHLVMALAADTFALRASVRDGTVGDVHGAHPAAEGGGG